MPVNHDAFSGVPDRRSVLGVIAGRTLASDEASVANVLERVDDGVVVRRVDVDPHVVGEHAAEVRFAHHRIVGDGRLHVAVVADTVRNDFADLDKLPFLSTVFTDDGLDVRGCAVARHQGDGAGEHGESSEKFLHLVSPWGLALEVVDGFRVELHDLVNQEASDCHHSDRPRHAAEDCVGDRRILEERADDDDIVVDAELLCRNREHKQAKQKLRNLDQVFIYLSVSYALGTLVGLDRTHQTTYYNSILIEYCQAFYV